jgi:hypothetical protein
LDWTRRLDRLAHAVNPLLSKLLAPMTYYWITAQAEYATDVVFKTHGQLKEPMPRLIEHSSLHFSAKDVMSFPRFSERCEPRRARPRHRRAEAAV